MPVEVEGTLDLSGILADGRMQEDGDLTISINPFYYDMQGTKGYYQGAVGEPVTDGYVNYVYLDGYENIQINTTGYGSGATIRLGRVIASGGFITRIISERALFTAGVSASTNGPASGITTDTTNFNVFLSSLDTTVQKALNTLDDHVQTATTGGTGFTTFAQGDIIFADNVNSLAKLAAGADGYVLKLASGVPTWAAESGDVTGPGSSTDNEVVIFDGATGKIIKGSSIITDGAGNITSIGLIDFTPQGSSPTPKEGRVYFDQNDKTLSIMTGAGASDPVLQVGQETFTRVYNNTGTTIPDGYVVYINGSFGDRPTVALASSANQDTVLVLGVATEQIANGQEGMITHFGLVRGIDTSSWAAGTKLYLSAIPGILSSNIPSNSDAVIIIGVVTKQDASDGIIFVDVRAPFCTGSEFPRGFENRTDSELSFDNGTRTFTIQPKSPATSFRYWSNNRLYIKTSSNSVAIPDTTGTHYFYYDGYDLTTTMVAPDFDQTWVASVLWDGNANIGLADERHTINMNSGTHKYLHESIGTKYISGLTGTQLSNGTGSSNTDAQFSLTSGIIFDEDIQVNIVRSATPSAYFEQELGLSTSIPGKFPVYYQDGYAVWKKDTATMFPMRPWDGYTGSRVGYSTQTGGFWSVAQPAADGNRVAYWIVATSNIEEPVIALMGVNDSSTFNDADDVNSLSSMLYYILASASVLPFREMKIMYRLIVRTSNTYTNDISAYIEDVKDYRNTSINVLDHSGLGGRDVANQHPGTAVSTDTSGFSNILSSADIDVQKALDTIDDHIQTVIKGGTEFTTYTTGDIIYANGTNSLAKLPIGSDGYHLVVDSGLPIWQGEEVLAGYQYQESLGRSTTTSTTFQTKLQLVSGTLNGTYVVEWSAVVDQGSRANSVEVQLYNVTDAEVVGVVQRHEPKDVNNRIHVGGFEEIVFTGPSKTLEIQYRVVGTNTAGIQDATIMIWQAE